MAAEISAAMLILFIYPFLVCRALAFGTVMSVLILITTGKRKCGCENKDCCKDYHYLFHRTSPFQG
ncbi:MAG: hypothetical protein ABIK15_17455 [Pseudomonadota bacterium]